MSIQSLRTSQQEISAQLLTSNKPKKITLGNANVSNSVSAEQKQTSSVSAFEAKKLLNDRVIAALEKTLAQSNPNGLYELDSADFTPEKVANRILSFISGAFAELDEDKVAKTNRLNEVRKGVETGFNDAKAMLESLAIFSGSIAENANSTNTLLQTGLDKMASNIESGVSIVNGLFESNDNKPVERLSSLFTQNFSFDLTTVDGDKVSIKVDKREANVAESNASLMQLTQSEYRFSIEGNLDDNERAAIDKLLTDMLSVTDEYFSGDTQAALGQISRLGYDTSQIVSFSLSLREVQQSQATSVYQQIDGNPLPNDKLNQLVSPIRDYADQLLSTNTMFLEKFSADDGNANFLALLEKMSLIPSSRNTHFSLLNEGLLEKPESIVKG